MGFMKIIVEIDFHTFRYFSESSICVYDFHTGLYLGLAVIKLDSPFPVSALFKSINQLINTYKEICLVEHTLVAALTT